MTEALALRHRQGISEGSQAHVHRHSSRSLLCLTYKQYAAVKSNQYAQCELGHSKLSLNTTVSILILHGTSGNIVLPTSAQSKSALSTLAQLTQSQSMQAHQHTLKQQRVRQYQLMSSPGRVEVVTLLAANHSHWCQAVRRRCFWWALCTIRPRRCRLSL